VVVSWDSQQGQGNINTKGQDQGGTEIKARMNPDDYYGQYKSIIGAQWHLEGPDGLGATVQFMIPKAYIPNQNTLDQFLLSNSAENNSWLDYDNFTITDGSGDYDGYWVVTVEDVNKF
jgi:hypothetical protein